jgi:hypothetical protein
MGPNPDLVVKKAALSPPSRRTLGATHTFKLYITNCQQYLQVWHLVELVESPRIKGNRLPLNGTKRTFALCFGTTVPCLQEGIGPRKYRTYKVRLTFGRAIAGKIVLIIHVGNAIVHQVL